MSFRHILVFLFLSIVGDVLAGNSSDVGAYHGCGHTANCFGFPKDCVTTSSCDFFFRSTFNKTGESFLFELISSRNYKQDTYLSVGFSELNKMSGITVECYTWSATGRVAIDYSFNSYDNIGRNEQIANNSQVAGFTDESVEYADGRLHCQWTVAAQGRVRYNRRGYDFVHQKYYVMLAKGVMASETRIGRHGHNNIISAKQIDLTKVETIHSGGTSMAIRWHGALMIFGWMGCTTVGILVARFSRDHCPNSTIFGLKVWFQMHRTWMFLGWVAMLASYIIIFVHFGGWTGSTFHTVGGLIAGLLATAQGMNSYLRPAPDSPKRWLFDYGHWFVGNAAHCLALANIIKSSIHRSSSFYWLVISHVLIYIVFSDLLKKMKERLLTVSGGKYRLSSLHQRLTLLFLLVVMSITIALVALMFQHG